VARLSTDPSAQPPVAATEELSPDPADP
jgi:hypothetical protein